MKIEVYGQEGCTYCEQAKQLLADYRFDFTYIDATNNAILKHKIVNEIAQGAKTFPVVMVNDHWIGGFNELKQFIGFWKADVDKLRELLKAGQTVTVVFIKENGDKRTMPCTTNFDLIPEDKRPKQQTTKTDQSDPFLFTIFDMGKQQWRSFKAQRLLSVH